jgi:hypothetical protein
MLRLIVVAANFFGRAAHLEDAAGQQGQLKRNICARDKYPLVLNVLRSVFFHSGKDANQCQIKGAGHLLVQFGRKIGRCAEKTSQGFQTLQPYEHKAPTSRQRPTLQQYGSVFPAFENELNGLGEQVKECSEMCGKPLSGLTRCATLF